MMSEWIRNRAKLTLLISALILLILIMAQIVYTSGLISDPRNAEVRFRTYDSNDSPTTYQYFVVQEVTPTGTRIGWKEVKIVTKEPCTDVHLNESKDPPAYECPRYSKAIEGKDYSLDDKDENGRISKGDSVRFNLKPNDKWGYEIAFKWKNTGKILNQDRLVPS